MRGGAQQLADQQTHAAGNGSNEDSGLQSRLAEALSQVQSLERQLADRDTSAASAQQLQMVAAQKQIAALEAQLANSNHAVRAEPVHGTTAVKESAERLRDASKATSRSASPGREQGELWRQVNSLQQRLQQVQADRDHMASALQRLTDIPNDTDAAIAKLEHHRHAALSHVESESQTMPEATHVLQDRHGDSKNSAEVASLRTRMDASAHQHQHELGALRDQLSEQQAQHAQQLAVLARDLKAAERAQQEQQAQHGAESAASDAQHREHIASLQNSIQNQAAEIATWESGVASARAEAQAALDSSAAAETEHKATGARLNAQHEAAEARQRAEVDILESRLQSAEAKHAAEVSSLQEALEAAQSQGQSDRDGVLASLQEQLEAQCAQHAEAVQQLQQQLQSQQQQHLTTVSDMGADFQTQAEQFQAEADSRQNALAAAHQQQVADLQDQVDAEQHQRTAVAEQLEALQAQHAQRAASMSELQTQLDADAERHQQQLADARQATAVAEARVDEIQTSSAQHAQQLRQEITQLQEQLSQGQSDHSTRVSELQSEAAAQLRQHEQAVARLERQLAAAVDGQSSNQAQQRLLHQEELNSLVSEHQVSFV